MAYSGPGDGRRTRNRGYSKLAPKVNSSVVTGSTVPRRIVDGLLNSGAVLTDRGTAGMIYTLTRQPIKKGRAPNGARPNVKNV